MPAGTLSPPRWPGWGCPMNGAGLRGRGAATAQGPAGQGSERGRGRTARPRAPRPESRGLASAPPGCRALRLPAVLGRAPLRAARPGLGSRFRPQARAFAAGRGLPGLPGGPRRPTAREGHPRARQALLPPRRSCSAPRPASVCRGGGGWAGARLLLREGAGAPARPRVARPSGPLLTH